MTLDRTMHRHEMQSSGVASRTHLISCVSLLTDCLQRADSLEGCGDVTAHEEAVRVAMEAALLSELRVSELLARLVYLERLATSDELTGLLNRRGFQYELERALAEARRHGEHGVLIYVDLDAFKPINDTHGHAAGDEVLRQVARLLRDNVRDSDHVARLGGDEFAALLTRTDWENGIDRAEQLDRLLNSVYVSWDGKTIAVRGSLGVQAYGPNQDGAQLLNQADDAMYRTKRARAEILGSGRLS